MANQRQATDLLTALSDGDPTALGALMPLVYEELKFLARSRLRYERQGHTLDTGALVHEAYLRMIQLDRIKWESRAHFLAIAAQAMRNILVSHARRRKRRKRGGGALHVPIEEVGDIPAREQERILDLDRALEALAEVNPRHARIVECRFFGGMTIEETAAALEISPATAKRDWRLLRLWLGRELGPES